MKEIPIDKKIALSFEEAAALSGVSRSTLFALARDGSLPSTKVRRRRLILRRDLERLLYAGRTRGCGGA